MYKKYDTTFFDWDGTATISRSGNVSLLIEAMKKVLNQKKYLVIISGTTYDKIAEGKLHSYFTEEELNYLFLGLGRGAFNYMFKEGQLVEIMPLKPSIIELSQLHKTVFELHQLLYTMNGLETDIIFSRPNYCKLDLLVNYDRGNNLFMQDDDAERVLTFLHSKGIEDFKSLVRITEDLGTKNGLNVVVTTDAKYLEVGFTTKSDNVNYLFEYLTRIAGITIDSTSFWGDEFAYVSNGVQGSDAYMITDLTKNGDFFDVSETVKDVPEQVTKIGGGTDQFYKYLCHLSD